MHLAAPTVRAPSPWENPLSETPNFPISRCFRYLTNDEKIHVLLSLANVTQSHLGSQANNGPFCPIFELFMLLKLKEKSIMKGKDVRPYKKSYTECRNVLVFVLEDA